LIRSAVVFAAASVIAVLISADNLTQIMNTHHIQLEAVKVLWNKHGKSDQSESEFYDYHTSWSFSPEEILTFIILHFMDLELNIQWTFNANQDVELTPTRANAFC